MNRLRPGLVLVLFGLLGAGVRAQVSQVFAPGVISVRLGRRGGADAPAFTPDGKTVVFDLTSIREGSKLYLSRRIAGRWSKPRIVPFSGRWIDQDPSLAPGGSYLIFASNRPRTPGGKPLPGWQCNLWRVARHRDGSWGQPVWLPATVNRQGHDLGAPSIAADGTLYFLDHAAGARHGHAEVSRLIRGQYTAPEAVVIDGAPALVPTDVAIAPDQSFMIFDVLRTNQSVFYRSQRRHGHWARPVRLGAGVNTGLNWDPRLTPDGKRLYFSSLRGGYTAIWFLRLRP